MAVTAPECTDPRCQYERDRCRRMEQALKRAYGDIEALKHEYNRLRELHSRTVASLPDAST